MSVQLIWFMMVVGSVLCAIGLGRVEQIFPAMLEGCEKAITLTLQLGAGYLLFCGLMEIARASGICKGLEKGLRPVLKHLMPSIQEENTREAIAMNLSMNMLGMGNAATPLGMEAVRRLDAESELHPETKHDLWMLLILNATSIQLMPTTVLTLRAAAGSADVNVVLLPSFVCTAVSTAVGAGLAAICRRRGGKNEK